MDTQKILLIEDDIPMLNLLTTLLTYEGFNIVQPREDISINGLMETVRSEKPDLVLLDVYLRSIDGFDLLHSIRQNEDTSMTRVIMSSGMDFSTRCKEEKADGFILKPYMPVELITKIRQVLN